MRVAPGVDAGPWTALNEAWRAAVRAQDWTRAGECYAPDLRLTSHQMGLSYELTRGDEHLASQVGMYGPDSDFLVEILGVRAGWALYLFHAWGSGDGETGPWEIGRANAAEIGSDGRFRRIEVWDEADVERARARFEELTINPRSTSR